MSQNTKIEWTENTWNPVTGCTPVSLGCKNCYARRMAYRLKGRFGYPADDPFRVTVHEDKIDEPLRWRKPRMVFVCSMGDLFHEHVDFNVIDWVISRMIDCEKRGHIFQILTKRPAIAKEYFICYGNAYLPKNIWFGVSCENQYTADVRIPFLESIPIRTKFVSFEPLLDEVNIQKYHELIDWIIVGGETGPGARIMELDWALQLQNQANYFNIPYFFKKVGSYYKQHKIYVDYEAVNRILERKYPKV